MEYRKIWEYAGSHGGFKKCAMFCLPYCAWDIPHEKKVPKYLLYPGPLNKKLIWLSGTDLKLKRNQDQGTDCKEKTKLNKNKETAIENSKFLLS